ncbi:hypothetical protein [Petroclostridium sp. X23]|uniref:hypothetical protein n=1 Tax=Petroclostridium sp. X23 TaxID=3045146 RepID=UPI0024AE4434|nr:hypothetical protein [Petroclostridium sp. X23]WHH60986.1 hypothetical protein QKW49_09885 [Petroclostridium sp. X23]
MLYDLICIFENAYKNHGDSIILNVYRFKRGIYIRINQDYSQERLIIDSMAEPSELLDWFKRADYYSSLISTQKAVDKNKKIHSNNYFSLFIKKDTVFGTVKKKALTRLEIKEIVDNYFNILESNKQGVKGKLVDELLSQIPVDVDTIILNRFREYLLKNLDNIINDLQSIEKSFEGYIKLFFYVDMEKYKQEYNRYLIPRVFNTNKYNIKIDGDIYGVSNNNISMNSKKPYLELKTMKCKAPYKIRFDDAIIHKKFFDWLKFQKNRVGYIPMDFDFSMPLLKFADISNGSYYYLNTMVKNDEVIITDYEYFPNFKQTINLKVKDYLNIIQDDNQTVTYNLNTLKDLEKEIDNEYFEGNLRKAYFSDIKTGNINKKVLELLLLSKDAFYSFFRKNNPYLIQSIFKFISKEIIKQKILDYDRFAAKQIYNLMITISQYIGLGDRDSMGDNIEKLYNSISDKISTKDFAKCSSDEEYFFLCGQLLYFISSKSKSDKSDYRMLEQFMNLKNINNLNRELVSILNRYKYAISSKDKRFKQAFSMIMGYSASEELSHMEDIFLAGFLSKNLIYKDYKMKEAIVYEDAE